MPEDREDIGAKSIADAKIGPDDVAADRGCCERYDAIHDRWRGAPRARRGAVTIAVASQYPGARY